MVHPGTAVELAVAPELDVDAAVWVAVVVTVLVCVVAPAADELDDVDELPHAPSASAATTATVITSGVLRRCRVTEPMLGI